MHATAHYTTLMNTADNLTLSTHEHSNGAAIAVRHTRGALAASTPHLMFCGGFHSAMTGTKATYLSSLCEEKQWHYTRFDYRAHGQSGGDAATLTLADWLDDTLAVLDSAQLPTLLIGSSMGAWLATLVALRRPELIKGLLLLAAAPDFLQELVSPRLNASHEWDLQQGLSVSMNNDHDKPYPITQALLDSGKSLSLLDNASLASMCCPVRLIHGTNDSDVPYTLSARMMEQLPSEHDARLTLLHGADHRLSDSRCLSYIHQELEILAAQIFQNS